LTFNINDPTLWIKFSIDNQENQTITGNTTLTNLPYGSHKIIVYACDTTEKVGASETINFTVGTQTEPFSTTVIVLVSAASVAVGVGIGVFVFYYFKKCI